MSDTNDTNDYLTSGSIRFNGLGSDVDFDSMIDQLVKAESFRVKQLEDWKEDWESKIEAFEEVNSSMTSLESNLGKMDTVDEFFVKEASSSDSSVLTASASTEAEEGTHNVEVNQLAQNEIMVSKAGFSSPDDQVSSSGDSTFEYTYGSETISVEVPEGTSLDGLINIINSDPDNPGVRAGSIKKGDGDYRLQLTGLDLGAANTLSVSDGPDGFDSNGDTNVDDDDFSTVQNAQNAQMRLDGFPDDGTYIERSTNTVDDLIKGVTLNLKDLGTSQVTVANDDAAIKENVSGFVEDVNEVLSLLQEKMKVETSGEDVEGSELTGNYGVQMAKQRIKDVLASKGLGFERDIDPFTSLGSVGITTETDTSSPDFGLLKVDQTKLSKALEQDPEEVAKLFSADGVAETDSPNFKVYSTVKGTTQPGVYDVQYSVDDTGNITSAMIDGKEAGIEDNVITANEGPAKGLALQVDNLNQGDYGGSVSVKEGKAVQLKDTLRTLTKSDGTFDVLEDNYYDIVDNIDKKIESELKRLDKYERNLRTKFAQTESLLGYYDNMQSMLNSQLKKLNND
ncbi:MAG: flagellar filament capping protein FliD [Desulfonatronovibrionaceae bacterium]